MKLFVKIVVNDQKQWKGGRKWIAIFIHFGQYTNDYSGVGRKCNVFYRFQGVVATAGKCLNETTFESVSRSCQPGNHSIRLGCQLYCKVSICTVFQTTWQSVSDVTHLCENLTKVNCGSRPQDY